MKTWCHAFDCHIGISRYINLSGHSSSHPPPSLQATTDHVTCCITEPAQNQPSLTCITLIWEPTLTHAHQPSPCQCCHSLSLSWINLPAPPPPKWQQVSRPPPPPSLMPHTLRTHSRLPKLSPSRNSPILDTPNGTHCSHLNHSLHCCSIFWNTLVTQRSSTIQNLVIKESNAVLSLWQSLICKFLC